MVIYCGASREAFLINFEERDSNELARHFNFSKQTATWSFYLCLYTENRVYSCKIRKLPILQVHTGSVTIYFWRWRHYKLMVDLWAVQWFLTMRKTRIFHCMQPTIKTHIHLHTKNLQILAIVGEKSHCSTKVHLKYFLCTVALLEKSMKLRFPSALDTLLKRARLPFCKYGRTM